LSLHERSWATPFKLNGRSSVSPERLLWVPEVDNQGSARFRPGADGCVIRKQPFNALQMIQKTLSKTVFTKCLFRRLQKVRTTKVLKEMFFDDKEKTQRPLAVISRQVGLFSQTKYCVSACPD
jgi:hypothetical protein